MYAMPTFLLFWLGVALGAIGFLIKIVMSTLPRDKPDVLCYLTGALVFGITSALCLTPIDMLDRTHIVLVIFMSYFGADVAHRLMSTR